MTLTAARLRQLVEYDPRTGVFTRLVSTRNAPAGTKTKGSLRKDGYRSLSVDGKNYLTHRLAWLYVHGKWPPRHTDHRNGTHDDNRLRNLRRATPAQNGSHRHRLDKRNTSGVAGVYWSRIRRKWVAQIGVNRRVINLGGFVKFSDAVAARKAAERTYHGAFRRQEQRIAA